MLPKAVVLLSAATTSQGGDTSMAESLDADLTLITRGQLQAVIDQLQGDNATCDVKLNNIKAMKVKMPLIERFNRIKLKLKGFLIQIRIKVQAKGSKLLTLANAVVYAGLFLTGEPLKWFKLYFLEFQENGLTTTNQEV